MSETVERFIVVDGCHNVRDVGGYETADGHHVRWGRLYRADGPDRLTPEGHRALAALDIATVIDFRSASEHGAQKFHHEAMSLPMADAPASDWSERVLANTDDLAARYYDMATTAGDTIAAAFEILADRLDRPALVHCAAGKDRTGIMIALVLGVLGVPDDVIAHDYGLSHEATARRREVVKALDPEVALRYGEMAPIVLTAHPSTMAALLATIESRHGDIATFVQGLGVPDHALNRLRALLLE